MATDLWSARRPFVDQLRSAAAAMHDAGIAVYLSEYMNGARYSDNVIEGDGTTRYANVTAWTMRANDDGTLTMAVCVRGGEHDLYEREYDSRDHLVLREDVAERFGRDTLAGVLRVAGMDVKKVSISASDNGFGTRDIDYLVTYQPAQ